jgi:transposase
MAYRQPERPCKLSGLEDWLRERLRRHRGNADVVRQELIAEKGIDVSLRTVERAVARFRQELDAEARACVRFETRPSKQMQIDFGERMVEISGVKTKVFLFVATLGYSRRIHVRAFHNERQESWFDGLESAFAKFGGVTEEVLFDNARALVDRHDRMTGEAVGFRQALGLPAESLRSLSGAHKRQDGAMSRRTLSPGARLRPGMRSRRTLRLGLARLPMHAFTARPAKAQRRALRGTKPAR